MISEVKIDLDIPIPKHRERRGRWKQEVQRLKFAGSSFFIPMDSKRLRRNLTSAICYSARQINMEVTTRTLTECGVLGVRVWRVK